MQPRCPSTRVVMYLLRVSVHLSQGLALHHFPGGWQCCDRQWHFPSSVVEQAFVLLIVYNVSNNYAKHCHYNNHLKDQSQRSLRSHVNIFLDSELQTKCSHAKFLPLHILTVLEVMNISSSCKKIYVGNWYSILNFSLKQRNQFNDCCYYQLLG